MDASYLVFVSVSLLASCKGFPQLYDELGEIPQPYSFEWSVRDPETGNDYLHRESSDGQTTQGEYRTLLPDGRLQIVTYIDNGNGYEANVAYEGEAQYPHYGGYQKRHTQGGNIIPAQNEFPPASPQQLLSEGPLRKRHARVVDAPRVGELTFVRNPAKYSDYYKNIANEDKRPVEGEHIHHTEGSTAPVQGESQNEYVQEEEGYPSSVEGVLHGKNNEKQLQSAEEEAEEESQLKEVGDQKEENSHKVYSEYHNNDHIKRVATYKRIVDHSLRQVEHQTKPEFRLPYPPHRENVLVSTPAQPQRIVDHSLRATEQQKDVEPEVRNDYIHRGNGHVATPAQPQRRQEEETEAAVAQRLAGSERSYRYQQRVAEANRYAHSYNEQEENLERESRIADQGKALSELQRLAGLSSTLSQLQRLIPHPQLRHRLSLHRT